MPRKVITIDYGEDLCDLYIRFKHADKTEGEPSADGKIILHYDPKGKIAALEVTDLTAI